MPSSAPGMARDARAAQVTGFTDRGEDGTPGPAEATGQIEAGDVIVAVNGQYTAGLAFSEVVGWLRAAGQGVLSPGIPDAVAPPSDHVVLRLVRPADSMPVEGQGWMYSHRGVKMLSSQFYSTFSMPTADSPTIVRGPFAKRIEAARAFDADVISNRGCVACARCV